MSTPCDAYLKAKIGFSANVIAEYGLLVADVFNACANSPSESKPPAVNNSLLDKLQTESQVLGYLVAQDAIFPPQSPLQLSPARVTYGALISFDGFYVIAIRGTASLAEWIINTKCDLIALPSNPGVRVEQGFSSVYGTMQYLPAADAPDPGAGGVQPSLVDTLKAAIGTNPLVITGHSLGAAIATYLAYDLTQALSPGQVRACFFASPSPGDQAFAGDFDRVFQANAGRYVVINNTADKVPQLPPQGLGFAPLPVVLPLSAANIDTTMTVAADALCNHHVVCYAAMLSSSAAQQYGLDAGVPTTTWASLLEMNGDQSYCLLTAQQVAVRNLQALSGG